MSKSKHEYEENKYKTNNLIQNLLVFVSLFINFKLYDILNHLSLFSSWEYTIIFVINLLTISTMIIMHDISLMFSYRINRNYNIMLKPYKETLLNKGSISLTYAPILFFFNLYVFYKAYLNFFTIKQGVIITITIFIFTFIIKRLINQKINKLRKIL